jgi:hypothetical protein
MSIEVGNVTHRNILGYLLQMFGRVLAASACIVPAGIVAVALYPHTRGIGFPVGLRLDPMAPIRALTGLDCYVGHFVGVGERIFDHY